MCVELLSMVESIYSLSMNTEGEGLGSGGVRSQRRGGGRRDGGREGNYKVPLVVDPH